MPKTKLGKWSIILIPAMVILIFVGTSLANSLYESVPAGDTFFEDIITRPLLAISMLVGFGSGISAFVTGLISIIKQKERAVLVFISTLIGAVVTFFVITQIIFS
jgi:hypothetical protein